MFSTHVYGYYEGPFCIECFHFQAHQVDYSLFSGRVDLMVSRDHNDSESTHQILKLHGLFREDYCD